MSVYSTSPNIADEQYASLYPSTRLEIVYAKRQSDTEQTCYCTV